jgi:hypothetical protein
LDALATGPPGWATFDANEPDRGGLVDLDRADDVRGVLGLDADERGQPLLVFEYSLPADTSSLFPTVAEAYGGIAGRCSSVRLLKASVTV